MKDTQIEENYTPSEEALKFIAFLRATGNEDNMNPEAHYKIADALFSPNKKDWKVVIECLRGMGKALALNEVVYTPTGPKTIKDVAVGDKIYDHTGQLTNVTKKSEVFYDDTYEVETSDGRVVTVCKDHQWEVFTKTTSKNGNYRKANVLDTETMFKNQWYFRECNWRNPKGKEQKYYVRLPEPVEYDAKDLPIDPYTLGVILGDGSVSKTSGYTRVTSHNDDAEELFSYIPYPKGRNSTPTRSSEFRGLLGLGKGIKELGLNVNTYSKFIPDIYKLGSVAQRLGLLRGLMDTDGTVVNRYSSSFSSCTKTLANDVLELARSLGMSAKLSYRDNGHAGHYRVYIKHRKFVLFKLQRKADKVEFLPDHRANYQKLKEIRKVDTVPTQCISVGNKDHLFLTTGYTVTHNSTVVEYAFIYVAVLGYWPNFGRVPFVVFLGASQEGNVKAFFKNVAGKIENSDFLRSLLDIKRQTDNEVELVNKEGVETIAAGRGMSTNWRGIRSRTGKRPTVLIADDVLPNDVMTSETIRKTIETNWFNSALPALDPMKHKIIYIGTPLSESDLLHQLKNSGAYKVIRFPLCPKFPVPEDEFESIWPDRFTYEYAKDLYDQYKAAGTTQAFYTEYLLQITDLSTLLVEEEDIQWFDPDMIIKNRHAYNFYISTDFATSTKKSADYSTIGVWAISSNSDWLLVDGQCKRQTMQDNINDLFKLVHKWQPLSVGIENSGQQGGFISIIQEMMMKRNIWFTFAKREGSKDLGIRPIKDKVHRFVTGVQPKFKQNKVWLPKPELVEIKNPRLKELVDELQHELGKFTMAGGVKALNHDDGIDLLNQLSEMQLYLPSPDAGEESSRVIDGEVLVSIWDDDEDEENFNTSTIF